MLALAKETFAEFTRHKAPWLAAAIAYFTVFAIAPLIIVVVEIAGFFLGEHHTALDRLYAYLSTSAGRYATEGVRTIVSSTFGHRRAGPLAQAIGWGVFVVAAVGLFSSLQEALNTIWGITPEKRTLVRAVRERLVAFGVVLAIALLLVVSLGLNAALTVAAAELAHRSSALPVVLKVLDFVLSFGLLTTLFALLFQLLPECRIAWRDVWAGAAISAVLFVAGQFVLGWYVGRVGIASSYGTFGGIIVFLIWVYYSAQIVLFGAEFTHVYAQRHGSLCASAAL